MNFASFELSIAAIIPAIILAAYIFFNDKKEKEPISLLVLLFAVGGIAYIPSYYLEKIITGLIDKAFSGYTVGSIGGVVGYTEKWAEYAHGLLVVFIGVALIEESVKWLVTFVITYKNKNFNCLYDGIVYASFVALGFATAENLHYAWQGGWDLLLLKSITTLPAHLLFAIVMGYLYTMWRTYKTAASVEKDYAKRGLITIKKPIRTWGWFVAMIAVPTLQHTVYGFAGYFGTALFNIIFYTLNTAMFVACIIGVIHLSGKDALRGRFADMLLDEKYPETKSLCDVVDDITDEVPTNE